MLDDFLLTVVPDKGDFETVISGLLERHPGYATDKAAFCHCLVTQLDDEGELNPVTVVLDPASTDTALYVRPHYFSDSVVVGFVSSKGGSCIGEVRSCVKEQLPLLLQTAHNYETEPSIKHALEAASEDEVQRLALQILDNKVDGASAETVRPVKGGDGAPTERFTCDTSLVEGYHAGRPCMHDATDTATLKTYRSLSPYQPSPPGEKSAAEWRESTFALLGPDTVETGLDCGLVRSISAVWNRLTRRRGKTTIADAETQRDKEALVAKFSSGSLSTLSFVSGEAEPYSDKV